MKNDISPAFYQCHVMRWVAFENMQPEYMQCCLITNQWGSVTEAQYTGEANIFTIGEERYEAKAWMELPPPFAQRVGHWCSSRIDLMQMP